MTRKKKNRRSWSLRVLILLSPSALNLWQQLVVFPVNSEFFFVLVFHVRLTQGWVSLPSDLRGWFPELFLWLISADVVSMNKNSFSPEHFMKSLQSLTTDSLLAWNCLYKCSLISRLPQFVNVGKIALWVLRDKMSQQRKTVCIRILKFWNRFLCCENWNLRKYWWIDFEHGELKARKK